jgi:putative ubiquitin-RnfH superfamily antitoxin RatB of RatAB toxin-antitoxin module
MANERNSSTLEVQVCYALPDAVFLQDVTLPEPCTLQDAILASGVMQRYPELDIASIRVGIFGKLKSLASTLHSGDRIEIYRPLQADPMESRRRRAAHKTGR